MDLVKAEPGHQCTRIVGILNNGRTRRPLACGAPAVVCNLDNDGDDFLCEIHRPSAPWGQGAHLIDPNHPSQRSNE